MGDISASLGNSLQLVYGQQTEAVAGLSAYCVVGCATQVVINPLAFTGMISAIPTALQAVAAPLAGASCFTIGAYSMITYGTTLNMNRGPEINVTGSPSPVTLVLAEIAAALGTADILTAGFLDPDSKAGSIADLGLTEGFGGALLLLTLSEVLSAVEGTTQVTTAAAADAEASRNLGAMNGAIRLLETAKDYAVGQFKSLKLSREALQTVVQVVNADFAVEAYTITEKSYMATILSAGAEGSPTECIISLDPGDPPLGQGIILAYADPAAEPSIQLNNQGVTLTAGVPGAGPKVALTAIAPTLGLTLSFGAVCSITLNAQGITLSYGPAGAGSSITLNAAGISLKCGATSLELLPTSIQLGSQEVGIMAENTYWIVAGALNEVVDGMASRTAASQSYLPG
jgi:hypothetical protein